MSRSHYACSFLMLFFLFLVRPSTSGRDNPFLELSSRTDQVEMAGYGEEKLSSVLVTGTVLCEVCLELDGEAELRAWPVSGALVAVSCKHGGKKSKLNWAKGRTEEYGDFIIDLPSHLHAIPDLEKACTVRVLRLPKNSPCRRVFVAKPKGIRLSSFGNSIRTFTAGYIRFQRPSKHSHLCTKKRGDSEEETSW